jgi:hypothetical protein
VFLYSLNKTAWLVLHAVCRSLSLSHKSVVLSQNWHQFVLFSPLCSIILIFWEKDSLSEKIEDKTRFFDWLNFQSATDYVPMTPLQAPPLREVDMTTIKHDAIIADSSRDCQTIQDEVTGRTLFTERALCPFHYVLNYNPKVGEIGIRASGNTHAMMLNWLSETNGLNSKNGPRDVSWMNFLGPQY